MQIVIDIPRVYYEKVLEHEFDSMHDLAEYYFHYFCRSIKEGIVLPEPQKYDCDLDLTEEEKEARAKKYVNEIKTLMEDFLQAKLEEEQDEEKNEWN